MKELLKTYGPAIGLVTAIASVIWLVSDLHARVTALEEADRHGLALLIEMIKELIKHAIKGH